VDDLNIRMAEDKVRTFGPFQLFPARQLLLCDGVPVKLGGRGFSLLNILVERQGELVSKRELMATAWPDTFVHESNLKVNMFALRKALGDDKEQPGYIATVTGRGYRFIAPVVSTTDAIITPVAITQHRALPPVTDIIGRAIEISDILMQLRQIPHVTIVGTGGVGKTTLALTAARAVEAAFPDGLCWVDLSVIDDPMLVPSTLASALGLRGEAGDKLGKVIDYLDKRQMLIVLDNCEHVLPAAALFARSLGAGRQSRILATSRTPLGTPDEQIVWLSPLESPPAGTALTAETARRYPAMQLLTDRARSWTGYELTEEDSETLGEICRRLDGIPLAIELAAGKLGQHAPQQLLAMLQQHLAVLEQDDDAAPRRHQTLVATIDWSYQLLTKDEALIFQIISVFAGTFDAADAAAVAASVGLGPAVTAASLGSLVAKSLVAATADRQGLSYRLLDTTQRHALDRLKRHPLQITVFRTHAERMLELFERSEREWEWRETHEWIAAYQNRLPDLRRALTWAFDEDGDVELGIRLTIAAIPVLFEISAVPEARQTAEMALRHPATDTQRMKLASSRAWSMLYGLRREAQAEDAWRKAVDFARGCGNADYHLRSLLGYSFHLNGSGRVPEAMESLVAWRELASANPQSPSAVDGERFFALVSGYMGRLKEARQILDRLALSAPYVGQRSRMAGFQVDRYIGTRNYLSFISWLTGHPAYAAYVADEGLKAAGKLGHLVSQSNVLAMAALPVAFWNGNAETLNAYTSQLRTNLEIEGTELWKPILRFYSAALPELRGGLADIDAMRSVIRELIDSRFTIRIGLYLSILADALASRQRLDEADEALDMAFDYQKRQSEAWCLPELQRVQASIRRRQGAISQAGELLETALAQARSLGALSFELRIATDLADHHLETEKAQAAVQTLEPVYNRFSEGFTTRNLLAASRVLRSAKSMMR
jgi:predicted ATPase/DNA-binding winged helix-turn-helix (wHTH) protein